MSQSRGSTGASTRVSTRVSNVGDRLGVGVLVLMFLGGLWLMAAPFVVGYQDRTVKWTTGTINIFVVGAGVALLALTTIILFVAGVLFELSRNSRRALQDALQDAERPEESRITGPGS